MKTTLATITLILGAITTTVVYTTVGVTQEAKNRVVEKAAQLNMTQRDTASKMILDYFEEPPLTEPYFITQPFLLEGCSYVPNVQRYIYTDYLGNKWFVASTTCLMI